MQRSAWAELSLAISGWGCMRSGRVLFRALAFELAAGQLLVLKGRNGAGKSTLLRSLAGVLPARAGRLEWAGEPVRPGDAAYLQQIAYLSHESAMSDALTGLENLRFALDLQGRRWNPERVAQALNILGVHDAASRAFGRLSQGQRRRLGLARVLLSDRPLWLLDEPDNALDDDGAQCLAAMLDAHRAAGGMAIVATHRGLVLPEGRMGSAGGARTLDLSNLPVPAPQGAAC